MNAGDAMNERGNVILAWTFRVVVVVACAAWLGFYYLPECERQHPGAPWWYCAIR